MNPANSGGQIVKSSQLQMLPLAWKEFICYTRVELYISLNHVFYYNFINRHTACTENDINAYDFRTFLHNIFKIIFIL